MARSRRMPAALALAATVVVGGGVPVLAQDASPAAMPAVTSLITPGTLSDCVDIEYKPMEYFPDGADVNDPTQAVGFDVDGARAVADKLGLKLEIRNTPFQALIPDLTNGRCDIVWTALYISDERLQVADAVPYLQTIQQVMVPAGNPDGIKAPDDLCGKAVAFQTGGLVETRIRKVSDECVAAGHGAIDLQGYATVAEEFQQVVLERVKAVWETDTAVRQWMSQNPGKFEIAYDLQPDAYGIYYGKGKADLGAALAAALKALKDEGVMEQLAIKYEQDPVSLDAIQ